MKLEEDVIPAGVADWLGDTDFEPTADAEPPAGSSSEAGRNEALTTLFLGLTVCLIAGVAWGVGLPSVMALVAGFVGAITIYLVVHVVSDRPEQ